MLTHLCEGVHKRRLLMGSSLLLHLCPACLVCLFWMDLEVVGSWPYSCCFVGCCFQDFFNIAHSLLVQFPSRFFCKHFVSNHLVYLYCRLDSTAARKKFRFILSDRSEFNMIDILSIAAHVFARYILMSLSEDETLLPKYGNLSSYFRDPSFRLEMFP